MTNIGTWLGMSPPGGTTDFATLSACFGRQGSAPTGPPELLPPDELPELPPDELVEPELLPDELVEPELLPELPPELPPDDEWPPLDE
jgi:hypothetical protein